MSLARRAPPEGFTLIEIMIVIAIIGVLSAVAFPRFADLIRKSDEGATLGNLGSLRSALSIYYSDMEGQFPSQLAGLSAAGRYLDALPYARIRPHHLPSGGESDSASFPAAETGGWWYDNEPADAAYGAVRVNCSHTDTKSSVWSSY